MQGKTIDHKTCSNGVKVVLSKLYRGSWIYYVTVFDLDERKENRNFGNSNMFGLLEDAEKCFKNKVKEFQGSK